MRADMEFSSSALVGGAEYSSKVTGRSSCATLDSSGNERY